MAFASRNPSQLHRIRDARRLANALDNDAPQRDTVNEEWFPDSANPQTHASTHTNGGTDEVDLTGLSGVLADAQTPQTHELTHRPHGSDALVVAVSSESALPTAGTQGRLRIATNGDGFYYDDGSQWINLGGGESMEVLASVGPTTLSHNETFTIEIPPNLQTYDLYLEVSGENSDTGTFEALEIYGLAYVSILRNGVWMIDSDISTSGDTILNIVDSVSVGDRMSAAYPLSLEYNRGDSSDPTALTIEANNGVTNAIARILGKTTP